jgi:cation:H+ antiporter
MIFDIIILIIALFFLVASSGIFVNSASRIAKQLGVSEFIIGLTLVAIGTSTPELFSGIFGSIYKNESLIIGNVIGANIANIALIFGLSLFMVVYLKKNEDTIHELRFLFFVYFLLMVFSIDFKISNVEGIIFVLLFAYYLFDNFRRKKKPIEYLERYVKVREIKKESAFDSIKNYLFFIGSLVVLIFSAKYLVTSAGNIANYFGTSSKMIGILLAIGTTFPELSVTIQAARKKYRGILVGDLVGSCIVNVLMVLGISTTISSITLTKSMFFDIFVMAFVALLMYLFFIHKQRKQKILGYSLVGIYILFLILELIFLRPPL